jgi:hypothetical protein
MTDEALATLTVHTRGGGGPGRAGQCECCRLNPITDKSHRINRSQGGTWALDNVLGACGMCHTWFTSYRDLAHHAGWIIQLGNLPITPEMFYVGMVPVWLNSLTLHPGWYCLDHDGSAHMTAWGPVAQPPALPPWVPPAILPAPPITVPPRSH